MIKRILIICVALCITTALSSCGKNNEVKSEKHSPDSKIATETLVEDKNGIEAETVIETEDEINEPIADENEKVQENKNEEIDIVFLDEMQGFWVRPEGYELQEGEDINEFFVEGDSWIPYFEGKAGQTLNCTADIDGLHLENIEGEIMSYFYDGIALLKSDGAVAFVRKE